jgi:hypothetical protein
MVIAMHSWRDMAADILAARKVEDSTPLAARARSDLVLPSDIALGIHKLGTQRAPRITKPDVWGEVVADARRLIDEGWAVLALALGWSAGDLFGVGRKDDWDFEGLAVWLRSRKLVMIDADTAIAVDGAGHDYFERGGPRHGRMPIIEPIMLWDFGR